MNFSTHRTRLAFAALLLAGSAQATLLTNGSFETQDIADDSFVSGVATGWTGFHYVMDPSAVGGLNGSNTPPWPQAAAGEQYADIGNGTGSGSPMSQIFTVATAGAYTLSWNDHTALTFIAPPWSSLYSVAISGASTWASGTLDAVQSATPWGSRSFVVNLNAGANTLSFTSMPAMTLDTLIDNVSITAVPEPGTWALLLAGMAAVGSVARRRTNA